MSRRPVLLSVVRTLIRGPPSPQAAGMTSGATWAKAPRVTDITRITAKLRIPTAAGNCGLTRLPSGKIQRLDLNKPEFSKIVGSIVYNV